MIFTCIHGRTAASSQAVECLDCEELAALRELETWERRSGVCDATCEHHVCKRLRSLDAIRRRKGIGAIGHPETREPFPVLHLDWCIGGSNGPCNCGAVK